MDKKTSYYDDSTLPYSLTQTEYMFLVARNRLLWGRKTVGRFFFFWERFFIFWDLTVVKTERSEVLAVKIEEKEKSLEEKE